jgi:hypothetical protein
MALNIGTAFTYNTRIGSEQTSMLAAQDAGFSSSTMGGASFVPWVQMLGTLASAYGARVSAKIDSQNLRFQGDMNTLNAGFKGQMSTLNAGYSSKSTLLGASFAEAMGRINARSIRDTAEVNARIAELGAQSALDQGNQQVASLTLKAGQLKSTQRAAMAANGIDLGDGNAVDVLASTEIMKEVDMNQITANAVRSAWGYRTQAAQVQADGINQSANVEIRARTEATNIRMNGASELMQIQTQGAWDQLNLGNTARANYAASNSISPDRAFTNTLVTGATGVADSWYRWNKVTQ